jgi:hypothetical protein
MFELFSLGVGFVAGLIVGWNFLAQPTWVKELLIKITG